MQQLQTMFVFNIHHTWGFCKGFVAVMHYGWGVGKVKYCLRGGALTNKLLQIPTQCPIAPQESVVGPVIGRRIMMMMNMMTRKV